MSIEITVPRLGWSMEEGTFVGWLKQDGESVRAGEPLFTLEGDKAAQEIEATESGTLRIPADAPRPGHVVSVGQVLGHLVSEGGGVAHGRLVNETAAIERPRRTDPKVIPSADTSPAQTEKAATRSQALAISPRARRRAAELGLNLNELKGSGRTGRIIEADVLNAANASPTTGPSTMRRWIAQRTTASFATVPHFYLRTEVDVTALLECREQLLPGIERSAGVRLTFTDLLLRAQGLALRDCPFANVIWGEDNLVAFPACDVGLVVGLSGGDGLLIPVVRSADVGDLAALSKQRASLVEAARAGRLTREAMKGGASSLSNLGDTRVDEFAAVIPAPHSSILAAGRAMPRPFVVEGKVSPRATLKLCLSVDHRVMDGGPATEFLGRIVELLVKPDELIGRR